MKKSDLAGTVARQRGVAKAAAADQLDRAIHQIIKALREGQSAHLPGLGTIQPGRPLDFSSGTARAASFKAQGAPMKIKQLRAPDMDPDDLARLIRSQLRRCRFVEIEGLGTFARSRTGSVSFLDSARPRVFIAYAVEDAPAAVRLYNSLRTRGYSAWLDRRKLLPGQNWPRRIEDAIASSDFFIACFSSHSVNKRGGFQAEIRYALDCASRMPLDDVFLIPARLDDCRVPVRIQRETQYVDLFPDWDAGFDRIAGIIEKQREGLLLSQ